MPVNEVLHVTELDNAESRPGVLQALYDGRLDVAIVHDVFSTADIEPVLSRFAADDPTGNWARPNAPVPGIDLRLLGVGAAPTATTPGGPAADDHFAAAAHTPNAVRDLFDGACDPDAIVANALARLAGVPAAVPNSSTGARFSPYTVRAMPHGQGLMLHHDNHYALAIYEQLAPQLDTRALLSWFVVLRRPTGGGRLCIYEIGPDADADLPRLAHGALDPDVFHTRVRHRYFDLAHGDLIVFASSRLYHTVEAVGGPVARVTLGGFAGLDADRQRCLFWS